MLKKVILMVCMAVVAFAGSEASFPADWKTYKNVTTPLAMIGALPDCNADVHTLPAIYKETVATYCAVKPGGPGAVEILVSASGEEPFAKRNGNYPDGATFILHLKDLKLLFVTTYKGNKPLYSIYTEDGQDVSNAPGSGLNPDDCRKCHTGYQSFCVNGQCGTKK